MTNINFDPSSSSQPQGGSSDQIAQGAMITKEVGRVLLDVFQKCGVGDSGLARLVELSSLLSNPIVQVMTTYSLWNNGKEIYNYLFCDEKDSKAFTDLAGNALGLLSVGASIFCPKVKWVQTVLSGCGLGLDFSGLVQGVRAGQGWGDSLLQAGMLVLYNQEALGLKSRARAHFSGETHKPISNTQPVAENTRGELHPKSQTSVDSTLGRGRPALPWLRHHQPTSFRRPNLVEGSRPFSLFPRESYLPDHQARALEAGRFHYEGRDYQVVETYPGSFSGVTQYVAISVDDAGNHHSLVLSRSQGSGGAWYEGDIKNPSTYHVRVERTGNPVLERRVLIAHIDAHELTHARKFLDDFGSSNHKVVSSRQEGEALVARAREARFPMEVALKEVTHDGETRWVVHLGADALHSPVFARERTVVLFRPSSPYSQGFGPSLTSDELRSWKTRMKGLNAEGQVWVVNENGMAQVGYHPETNRLSVAVTDEAPISPASSQDLSRSFQGGYESTLILRPLNEHELAEASGFFTRNNNDDGWYLPERGGTPLTRESEGYYHDLAQATESGDRRRVVLTHQAQELGLPVNSEGYVEASYISSEKMFEQDSSYAGHIGDLMAFTMNGKPTYLVLLNQEGGRQRVIAFNRFGKFEPQSLRAEERARLAFMGENTNNSEWDAIRGQFSRTESYNLNSNGERLDLMDRVARNNFPFETSSAVYYDPKSGQITYQVRLGKPASVGGDDAFTLGSVSTHNHPENRDFTDHPNPAERDRSRYEQEKASYRPSGQDLVSFRGNMDRFEKAVLEEGVPADVVLPGFRFFEDGKLVYANNVISGSGGFHIRVSLGADGKRSYVAYYTDTRGEDVRLSTEDFKSLLMRKFGESPTTHNINPEDLEVVYVDSGRFKELSGHDLNFRYPGTFDTIPQRLGSSGLDPTSLRAVGIGVARNHENNWYQNEELPLRNNHEAEEWPAFDDWMAA